MAIGICATFPPRECLQVSLLDGPQDLARKLREAEGQIILDLHGLSLTEFLNVSLTMGLAGFNDGGLSKDLGWCAKLTLRASKMPLKILLLMPPYLAQRLEIFPGGHEVKEWWLDDAWSSCQGKHELSLSSLLEVEKLWSVLVRPICEEMVENSRDLADADQKRFAVELLSEALKRAMPLLNPDDTARVMAVQRLAERKIELGSLRSLVKAVACSSARHVACRFWPWLQRCMSDFSATTAGREILLRSIRMASLSFMSKLQPVGDLQQVLLECPKRSPDVSELQKGVIFPFTEELLSVIGRVAEHSWGAVAVNDLVQTLSRVWPDLLLPLNDLENVKIMLSSLAQKLPGHSLLVPQQYLESIRNLTSNEGALFVVCSELALLKALSFIGDEVGEVGANFEDGPQVLLKACRASNYYLCQESLLALREASRCVSHPELSRVAAVWWALVQLSNQDLESAWQDAWALIDDVSMPQNVRIPLKIPLVMGLVQLCPERAKRLFPVLVQSHPEGAAFLLARALQDPPSPNDARDQLGRLSFWLDRALDDAAWSPEYLESPQAKFACSLLSFWLKGMNLEKWLQSFSEINLFDSEAAETLSVLAFAFHVLPRVAQNWTESVANSMALKAFQRMADVTGLRRPLQNYFVRMLAYHHGENLAPFATSLETFGDWIYPFIRPPPSEADREVVRQLMFLPNFKELLEVTPNWYEAFLEAMQMELKEDTLEQVKQLLKTVASVEELGPLRSAAVIWLILILQDPSSAFHPSHFNLNRVKTYLLPLQQPNEIHRISGGTDKYWSWPRSELILDFFLNSNVLSALMDRGLQGTSFWTKHDNTPAVLLIVRSSFMFFRPVLETSILHLCANLSLGRPSSARSADIFIGITVALLMFFSNSTGAAGAESPTSLAIAVRPWRSANVQHAEVPLEAKAISYWTRMMPTSSKDRWEWLIKHGFSFVT